MQVDVEMYLAASPPLFVSPLMGPLDVSSGRSAFRRQPITTTVSSSNRNRQQLSNNNTSSSISSFNGINSLDFSGMTLSPAFMRSAAESFGRRNLPRPFQRNGGAPVITNAPLRSCLVIRSDVTESSATSTCSAAASTTDPKREEKVESEPSSPVSEEPSSPTKLKKRVVFADAKGLSLTQVKTMTEPSDCPPRWTAEFLEQVTGGASAEVAADRWEMTFAQPASDYLDFRSRLDKQNLSLENALIQEADQQLVGTVKVKNLSFSKQVTVRITFDNWLSHTDVDATFAPSGLQGATSGAAINLFDTFSFKIPIPAVVPSNRIQFCLRFSSDAGEFWDNNAGKNYVIVKPIIESLKIGNNRINGANKIGINGLSNSSRMTAKYSDLLSPGSKVDYWTDFASWNHLVNDSPYWWTQARRWHKEINQPQQNNPINVVLGCRFVLNMKKKTTVVRECVCVWPDMTEFTLFTTNLPLPMVFPVEDPQRTWTLHLESALTVSSISVFFLRHTHTYINKNNKSNFFQKRVPTNPTRRQDLVRRYKTTCEEVGFRLAFLVYVLSVGGDKKQKNNKKNSTLIVCRMCYMLSCQKKNKFCFWLTSEGVCERECVFNMRSPLSKFIFLADHSVCCPNYSPFTQDPHHIVCLFAFGICFRIEQRPKTLISSHLPDVSHLFHLFSRAAVYFVYKFYFSL